MDTIVLLALPETIPDANPITEAINPTVMVTDVAATAPAPARGRPKKAVVPSLVKAKKALTPEERVCRIRGSDLAVEAMQISSLTPTPSKKGKKPWYTRPKFRPMLTLMPWPPKRRFSSMVRC
jgi:hypothetical protein